MREEFLHVIKGNTSDRVPWVVDLNYWIDFQLAAGRGHSRWKTETGYIELCRELGCMPYNWSDAWRPYRVEYHGDVEYSEKITATTRRYTWKTAIGEIFREWTFAPLSFSWAPTRYAVQSKEDLEVFRYVVEHRVLEPEHLDDYRARMVRWKQYDGLPGISMTQDPLAQMIVFWCGVKNTAYLMNDIPDLMTDIFRIIYTQELRIVDAICESAPPLVHILDNQSSDLMAGYFDRYMAPRYRRINERFHQAGCRVVTHIDGTIWPLLKLTAGAGFDGVEGLTPEPSGDMTVEEISEKSPADAFVLWGGVPAVLFSPPHSWQDMRSHLERVLEAWNGRPFILGVGDCVPGDGQIGFMKKIADMLEA